MFIDEAEIHIRSGKGGPGCVSFRREKFVPMGGPNGGDGGRGGDVVFEADAQLNTLLCFAGKHHWHADNGRPGEGSLRTGKSAAPLRIRVPPGTAIYDRNTGVKLTELLEHGREVTLLKGGKGGRGNRHFVSSIKQAPRVSTPGGEAQERWLKLELKLIADVGLVGLPNAGKSTLLSRSTRARPKIADYPFTTLTPQLGIVELENHRQYVMADIPGLIEGAHTGAGLGDAFLKHIERTRLIVHVIDLEPPEGQPSPAEAYAIIRGELGAYSDALANKPEIIVGNKMDLTAAQDCLHMLRDALNDDVLGISAVSGHGLERLHRRVWDTLTTIRAAEHECEEPHP